MPTIQDLIARMRANPRNIRFCDAKRVCQHYFGPPRVHGSHHVFRTPWPGDPRVNIQDRDGMVAPYQVRQLLHAVERMEDDGHQSR